MADRDALRAAADAEIARWERLLTDELAAMWDRQRAVVLARLGGVKARKGTRFWEPPGETKINAGYVLDASRWIAEAVSGLRPLLTRLFATTTQATMTRLGAAPTDVPEALLAQVGDAVELQLQRIGIGVTTAVEAVQGVIDAGGTTAASIDELAARVDAYYAQHSSGWAGRIVSTSVVGSLNQASLLGAAEAGCERKQWLSAHDNDVRPTHRVADGQVVAVDAVFVVGAARLEFPGDPEGLLAEVIRCRCTMLFPEPGETPYAGGAAARGVIRARSAVARGLDPLGPDHT